MSCGRSEVACSDDSRSIETGIVSPLIFFP
jgi:hypothetical protein